MIEWHARFHQGLDHADMGKTARAASSQHQSHSALRHETCEPPDILRLAVADVMVPFEQPAVHRKLLRQSIHVRFRMEQHQHRRARRAFLEGGKVQRLQRQWPVGAGEQKHAVSLPQT